MKTIRTALSIALAAFATVAVGQINTPQPSSAGSVSATVGLTEVTIDYFRPKVKGRQIFGEGGDFLQPFGQLWRTGANSGSKLSLSTDANIGGTDVPAGEYLIFSTPGKDSWEVMLYSDLSIGGNTGAYDKSKEVMRTSVKPMWTDGITETMTFNISDISEDNTSANIELAWANAVVKVPVKVNFHDMVLKDIESKMQIPAGNYTAAANYYLATNTNLEKALEYMNTYLAMEGRGNQFWHIHTKAKILKALGDKEGAMAAAQKSYDIAAAAPNDFGYKANNENLMAEIKKMKKSKKK